MLWNESLDSMSKPLTCKNVTPIGLMNDDAGKYFDRLKTVANDFSSIISLLGSYLSKTSKL